jgi:hypothetical protein
MKYKIICRYIHSCGDALYFSQVNNVLYKTAQLATEALQQYKEELKLYKQEHDFEYAILMVTE